MIPDLDIYRAAKLLIDQHGEDAPIPAAERADELLEAGDTESAAILNRIYRDEIRHVATGLRWFDRLCWARGLSSQAVFQDRVRRFFKGDLKPPFNHQARTAAGFHRDYYEPLAAGTDC